MTESPARLTDAELAALPPVRAEEHIGLAKAVLVRTIRRPDEDDLGDALLALVEAAAQWNAGKRPSPWGAFAAARVRWGLLYRFQLASAASIRAEVPLFLHGEDEDDEFERPEMAVEDPGLAAAEARVDVRKLLAGLHPTVQAILARRFGLDGDPATREEIAAALGLTAGQVEKRERRALATLGKRATRRTFTIPLDSGRGERLR